MKISRLLKFKAKSFRRSDDGQVMLAFAMSLMLIVSSIGVVVNVGETVKTKIYAQTAADAAALGAGAWMARGSNLLQILNGMHWDVNGFAGTVTAPILSGGSTAISALIIAMAVAAAGLPWTAGTIASMANTANKIRKVVGNLKKTIMKGRKTISGILVPIGSGVNGALPLLSALHANGLAEANYADRLDEVVLGSVMNMLQIFDDVIFKTGMFDSTPSFDNLDFPGSGALKSVYNAVFSKIFAWPISPSPIPYKANKFAKYETGGSDTVFNVKSSDFMCWFWPQSDLKWNEKYAQPLSDDDLYITYLAGKIDKREGLNPALGALRQIASGNTRDKTMPALATVGITGGPLSPSGDPDNEDAGKYYAIWAPDKAAPLPMRLFHIFDGDDSSYSGDFDVEYQPVKIKDKEFAKFGVLH